MTSQILKEKSPNRAQRCARRLLLKTAHKGKAPRGALLSLIELTAKLNACQVTLPQPKSHPDSGLNESGKKKNFSHADPAPPHSSRSERFFFFRDQTSELKSGLNEKLRGRHALTRCIGWRVSKPDQCIGTGSSAVGVLPLPHYDGLGRRITKTEFEKNLSITERYNYEGLSLTLAGTDTIKGNVNPENIKQERTEVGRYRPVDGYQTNNSQGNPTGQRNFATRGLQIVSENGTRGQINYTTDLRGSVRYETTTKDSKTETYNYDVFGESIGKTPEFFGYTGKPFDPQTKMYNYGYRDYAPKTARFTSIDPIRDGANWFSYVGQDPVNSIDAYGLSASDNGLSYTKTINDSVFDNITGPLALALDTSETWRFSSGSLTKHDYLSGGINSDLSLKIGVGKWDPSHTSINADLGVKIGSNLSMTGSFAMDTDFDSYNQTKLGVRLSGSLAKTWDFTNPTGSLAAKIDFSTMGNTFNTGFSTDFSNASLSLGASLLSGSGNKLKVDGNLNFSNEAVKNATLGLSVPLGSSSVNTSLSLTGSSVQNASLSVSIPLGVGSLNIGTSGNTPLSLSYSLSSPQSEPEPLSAHLGLVNGIKTGIETANQVWGWFQ